MSVAVQVMLLVVAIVVAVAGIGLALALRLAARPPAGRARRAKPDRRAPRAAAAAPLAEALSSARRSALAEAAPVPKPAEAPDPGQAHKAKLAALQALLELGDAKAEAAARSGGAQFANTEPAGEGYATTQFVDRSDSSANPAPLLNLDKLPAKRARNARS